MAVIVLLGIQLVVGGWGVSPWFGDGDVVDIVAILILGVSALAGVPGSVLTLVARTRPGMAGLARAALRWSVARLVLLVAVTAAIVAATDPGAGGEWAMDWEIIVLAALEIGVSAALAHDTAQRRTGQRRTQVYAP